MNEPIGAALARFNPIALSQIRFEGAGGCRYADEVYCLEWK